MGGVGYVGQSLAYFTALTMTSAALLALLLYLYPILVAVLAAVVLKVAADAHQADCCWVLPCLARRSPLDRSAAATSLGIALGITAALIYACYILAPPPAWRGVHALASSAVITSSAALVFLVLAAVHGSALPRPGLAGSRCWRLRSFRQSWPCSRSWAAWRARADRYRDRLHPGASGDAAAGVALLGETLAPLQLVGGACILAAVVRLARGDPRR